MATPSLQESTFIIQKIILHTVNQSTSCPTLKTSTFSSFSGFRYSLAASTIFPTPKASTTARFRGLTCPLPAAAATTILPTPKTSTTARFRDSAALCLPPPSPKRAFMIVSGFLLPPPPCQPRKRARLLVFGVAHPLPAATTTTIPETSTNARFWVLTALHHLPTPPSACRCHHYPQNALDS